MKRVLFSIITICSCVVAMAMTQEQTLDRLASNMDALTLSSVAQNERVNNEFIEFSNHGRYNDLTILELYLAASIEDEQARKLIATLDENGQWSDIDYTDNKKTRWSPAEHSIRIYAMTKLYKSPDSELYNNKELFDTISSAIDYWHGSGLVCLNWWYNQVRMPKHLAPVYLLLKDELTAEQLEAASKLLSISKISMTGQNKVWLSGNVFSRAILEGDLELAKEARNSITEEVFYTVEEGLQYDNSFHQHGAQMQFGNYGLAYVGSLSYWARAFGGTSLAFTDTETSTLRNFLLEGLQWCVWRGYIDPSASARQVFENSQKGKAHALAIAIQNIMEVDKGAESQYAAFIERNQNNPQIDNNLVGNKYFWRSDYSIQRNAKWYASVRMHSDRIIPYEMTNEENRQGIYSSNGALMLMIDGDEYENIYPLWDWKRLPGTTVSDDGEPIPFSHPKKTLNKSDFVGGVSNGEHGATVIELDYDGMKMRKSYFFIDDVVVALGSGITFENNDPVFTSLEQRLRRDGAPITIAPRKGKAITLSDESMVCDAKWFHHDKVGYYLLEDATVEFSSREVEQSWHRVASFFPEDQIVKDEIFGAAIKHADGGRNASYGYVLLPNRSLEQSEAFAKSPSIEIVENNTQCQAIKSLASESFGVVFYQAGEVNLAKKLTFSSSAGIIAMIERSGDSFEVSLADPTQKLDEVIVTIKSNNTTFEKRVELPTKEGMRGSTVTFTL